MSPELTQQEFSRHLNSKFQLKLDDHNLELQLVEVTPYMPRDNEQSGLERFSAYFEGPAASPYLPQQLYHLEHADLGGLDLFLVPISGDGNGFRYEAVFNYFKSEPRAVAGG